ncbi:sensor histidine kinase [Paenibacillus gorillae]|uniref:sensor histidine kinase n=1 Tax=Paenibacillus gorillae TaxID=1243662 RepID=UPI0004B1A4AE|nr:HAMP domain-containing sensor histidine kinase [Paenibacillus gorillae]
MRFRFSLKLKMSLVLAILLILTVGVLSELVLRGITLNQQQRMEEALAKQSQVAAQYVRQNYITGEERLPAATFMSQNGKRLSLYLAMLSGLPTALYDASGKETGSSLTIPSLPDYSDTLEYALKGSIAYQTAGDSVVYFAPIRSDDGGVLGVLRMHYSTGRELHFVKEIRDLFRTAGLIVLAAGFLIGYGYFYRLAAVISKLRRASREIREGHYLKRTPVRRRDELGDLGNDIYYMSGSIEANIAGMQEEQRKLELAIRKLQELERQQKQFIGNISHEFKTPLTAIRAYIDLLGMYRDDPKLTEEAIDSMDKESERLYEMVDKVLHLAELEKYDFEHQAEPVALDELLLDLSGRMRGKAAKFDLTIETILKPSVVWADRENLIHIFINLLDNAIKYNLPGGRIVIRTEADEDGQVIVTLEDTGIGIPAEARDKIFEPFFTVNKDRARRSGGTGLGLSLVKQLTEAQGGVIGLFPAAGGGTVFRITFPMFRNEA